MLNFFLRDVYTNNFATWPCIMLCQERVDSEAGSNVQDFLAWLDLRQPMRIANSLVIVRILPCDLKLLLGVAERCHDCLGLLKVSLEVCG